MHDLLVCDRRCGSPAPTVLWRAVRADPNHTWRRRHHVASRRNGQTDPRITSAPRLDANADPIRVNTRVRKPLENPNRIRRVIE